MNHLLNGLRKLLLNLMYLLVGNGLDYRIHCWQHKFVLIARHLVQVVRKIAIADYFLLFLLLQAILLQNVKRKENKQIYRVFNKTTTRTTYDDAISKIQKI